MAVIQRCFYIRWLSFHVQRSGGFECWKLYFVDIVENEYSLRCVSDDLSWYHHDIALDYACQWLSANGPQSVRCVITQWIINNDIIPTNMTAIMFLADLLFKIQLKQFTSTCSVCLLQIIFAKFAPPSNTHTHTHIKLAREGKLWGDCYQFIFNLCHGRTLCDLV